ncbi:hypothetical protein, partial [Flavobacterium filum]|uniref:hypothetical protein n=1 Tax=Flavobacterium filum TaxID=370974 RepID=UPI0023F4BFDD
MRILIIIYLCNLLITSNLFGQKNDLIKDSLNGKIKEIKYFENSKLVKLKKFNSYGLLTEVAIYNAKVPNAKPYEIFFYEYDKRGNKILESDELFKTVYSYDKNDSLIELVQYHKSNNKKAKNVFYEYKENKLFRTLQTRYKF